MQVIKGIRIIFDNDLWNKKSRRKLMDNNEK